MSDDQLTPSQRAEEARRVTDVGWTTRMRAPAYRVSVRSVEQARTIARRAPELSDEIRAGVVTLHDAMKVLPRPATMRRKALEMVHAGEWPTLNSACAVLSGADPAEVRKRGLSFRPEQSREPVEPQSDPGLPGRMRNFLVENPGCGARTIAAQLGVSPAAVQDAAWAEGLEVWGLPDPADMLEGLVQYGQTTMFEIMRRTKLSRAAITGVCRRLGQVGRQVELTVRVLLSSLRLTHAQQGQSEAYREHY